MAMLKSTLLAVVCAISALLVRNASAAEACDSNFFIQVSAERLPAYDYNICNPLYASISGYLNAKPIKIEHERELDLKIPGFATPVEVLSVVQNHPAPLVVVLPGLTSIVRAPFSRVWPAWFAEAGYHVLSFDSTFTARFNEASRHGVSGNVWREAELVADLIAAYLRQSGVEGKLTGLGLVGMSYGAVQALILKQMEAEGKLPFRIDAVQAWSPPVNLEHSARILNRWLTVDRPKYCLMDLEKIAFFHNRSREDAWPDSLLRAAIAESFHQALATVIVQNDERYKLNLLPHGNDFDDKYVRYDGALALDFMNFAYDIAYPYWQRKLNLPGLGALIEAADVCNLLKGNPACTEVIIAADDPLDRPEDLQRLKACAGRHLTVLPRGGHLGYANAGWTHMKLLTLFDCVKKAR